MYVIFSGLIFVVAILIILIVLVQNSKGGGLASNFSSSNQVMGVRKTTDFLEKATWTLAVSLVVLSVLASATIPKADTEGDQTKLETVDFTNQEQAANFPTEAPDLNDDGTTQKPADSPAE